MEVWQHFVKKLLPYFRSFKLLFSRFQSLGIVVLSQ